MKEVKIIEIESGEFLMFTRSGEFLYKFGKDEKPEGIQDLYKKIVVDLSILEQINSSEFFKNRTYLIDLKNLYEETNKKQIDKAYWDRNLAKCYYLQDACSKGLKFIDDTFERKNKKETFTARQLA